MRWLGHKYIPFERRGEGFIDRIKKEKRILEYNIQAIKGESVVEYAESVTVLVPKIKNKYDGIFFYADDGIQIVYEYLQRAGSKIDIITILGNGDLEESHIPVVFLDHAEKKIAQKLIETILDVLKGRDRENKSMCVYVKPRIHTSMQQYFCS